MNARSVSHVLVWPLLLMFGAPASAAFLSVSTTNDTGPGAFRQALLDANASAGADVISFDIPGPGPYTIRPATQWPEVRSPVVIDGRTQPGFSNKPIVELNGSLLTPANFGLHLSGGNSVLQGLVLNGFPNDAVFVNGAGGTVIRGNFIGTDREGANAVPNGAGIHLASTNHLVGGTNATDRNIISGNRSSAVLLAGAGNRVQGNFIGTDWTGKRPLPNPFLSVYVLGSSNNLVGGPAPEMRNIIAGGSWLSGGVGNVIQGNFFGTDLSGTGGLGGNGDWLYIWNGANRNFVTGNVLSGGGGNGIFLDRAGPENVIQGNIIGADITGTNALPNGGHGILLRETSGQVIGGAGAGQGNLIAFNMRNGVGIESALQTATNNSVRGNRIFTNAQIAIDLGLNGATVNDTGDTDSGPNNYQNYPRISTALTNGDGTVTLTGTIDTTPNLVVALDFFAASAAGGEAELYLGATNINAGANGFGAFFATFNLPAAQVESVTATATDSWGNSSELAPPAALGAAPLVIRGGDTIEGDSGVRAVSFEISATFGTNETVCFETVNGTAIAGIDFVATNGFLNFTTGTTSHTVLVSVTGDILDETNETFFLAVRTSASLTHAAAVILDDDSDSDTLAITQQPQSQTVRSGTNVTFLVSVVSSTPVSYQWQFNGADIPGATSSNLTIMNVQLSHDGQYSVRLSNGSGTYQSDPANLTVLAAPRIIQDPLSQSIVAGGAVTFSASVFGNPAFFTYEWRKLTAVVKLEISDETNSFLTLANVSANDAGMYRVVVRNQANPTGVGSRFATLTVLADSDSDGMPDVWESAHGLDPGDADDAGDDTDGDGLKNAQEYAAGTNPTNQLSTVRIERIATTNSTDVWFDAASNRTYTVQFAPGLEPNAWSRLADVVARPTNYNAAVHDPDTQERRFYRLVTPRQP
jgi:hypothetical protein